MTIIFCLIPSISEAVLIECSGFSLAPYSILWVLPNAKNYGLPQAISYTVALLVRVRELSFQFLSLLYWGVTGSKLVNSPLAIT